MISHNYQGSPISGGHGGNHSPSATRDATHLILPSTSQQDTGVSQGMPSITARPATSADLGIDSPSYTSLRRSGPTSRPYSYDPVDYDVEDSRSINRHSPGPLGSVVDGMRSLRLAEPPHVRSLRAEERLQEMIRRNRQPPHAPPGAVMSRPRLRRVSPDRSSRRYGALQPESTSDTTDRPWQDVANEATSFGASSVGALQDTKSSVQPGDADASSYLPTPDGTGVFGVSASYIRPGSTAMSNAFEELRSREAAVQRGHSASDTFSGVERDLMSQLYTRLEATIETTPTRGSEPGSLLAREEVSGQRLGSDRWLDVTVGSRARAAETPRTTERAGRPVNVRAAIETRTPRDRRPVIPERYFAPRINDNLDLEARRHVQSIGSFLPIYASPMLTITRHIIPTVNSHDGGRASDQVFTAVLNITLRVRHAVGRPSFEVETIARRAGSAADALGQVVDALVSMDEVTDHIMRTQRRGSERG